MNSKKVEKKIKQILVDGKGWVHSDSYGQIEAFFVNGEMSLVTWYRKGNDEFNGKYVIQVTYES